MKLKLPLFRHSPRRLPSAIGSWLALLAFSHTHYAAAELTLPEQLIGASQGFLEVTVQDYLERSEIQARQEIQINRLDPRLQLALCDEDLTTSLESPAQPVGRVTVKVSCEGATPWTVFVPAQVKLYRKVVIAIRPLKRDTTLGEMDVALVERDVGLLTQGYMTDMGQVLGTRLTRGVMTDQVLAPVTIEQAKAIRKKDQVVISARKGGINVRMPGEALSDGVIGEQIRIRNLSSQRVIRARVVGPGQVDVQM
ncbi:flagellar basal body P-ring formation chaperone FlgA [Pseudomonas sp. GV071]|jgi:flagella basal body P-ring formation protein FlgA|uniref:flagellar basal body P-ring formation chaperone FlgA n=1 Tax=Pseudomonas sp. GV071 TaxID=2135754 RepID=UPI000D390C1B|nr:flagellar basal body P-ring formation chaperone FlgA [Pseudomonas sp. GV071]